MKSIITPTQVVALAFTDGEYFDPQVISEWDIVAAEQRYIIPAVGERLHARLVDGGYTDFVANYLATPTALFTRLLIQPTIEIRQGQYGAVAPRSDGYDTASEPSIHAMRRSIRTKARMLLNRAIKELERSDSAYPEYNPDHNILRRCTIEGDWVLTR